MAGIPESIPIADLRDDAEKVLGRLQVSGRPVILTEHGRASAVLMSVEAYHQAERERELLRLLARGDREVDSGQGHDLDDLLAEIDDLLASEDR